MGSDMTRKTGRIVGNPHSYFRGNENMIEDCHLSKSIDSCDGDKQEKSFHKCDNI